MLEKEAEEYAKETAIYYESAHGYIPSQFEKYIRKAVEFGYSKVREENKLKWHKVADGDLPKNSKQSVIGILKDSMFVVGHLLVDCTYSKGSGWSDCYGGSLYNEVEYWAEVEFPKYTEE